MDASGLCGICLIGDGCRIGVVVRLGLGLAGGLIGLLKVSSAVALDDSGDLYRA